MRYGRDNIKNFHVNMCSYFSKGVADNVGVWEMDNIHMCVPGWEDLPSKASLPIFFEFFEHHYLIGIDHIFTGILFGWESTHTKTILHIFGDYIDQNLLSITTHSGDGIDGAYR